MGTRMPRWLDGLRGRIAAALVLALAVQFIGSEFIFEHVEKVRMEQVRAQRLAERLVVADEFAATRPDAMARLTRLWQPDLFVTRSAEPPSRALNPADPDITEVERLVLDGRPHLRGAEFQAMRDGNDLTGWIRLSDGGGMAFRATGYFDLSSRSQLHHYALSALLLLLCVILIALMFGRMIARPLRKIADAAERVGREEAVSITVEGPREVRQVASAFERMQARLLEQVQDKLQSMAAMSHDLRTPLARMRLNAATVSDNHTRAALQQDVDEMESFVSSVLDYLRGDEPEAAQRADVASIVMTVIDDARDAGEDVDYTGPDGVEAVTRPLKLKRLVRNIIQNATRHGGNAHVLLSSTADDLRIIVTDDGPGIPEEQLDAVFEPFCRIETSRNRQTGGSGLGLAIARRLAARLGGTITLTNRAEGGLEAEILLPLHVPES